MRMCSAENLPDANLVHSESVPARQQARRGTASQVPPY